MIKIPADLRPRDGRFGSGPSKVPHEAVATLSDAAPGYLGTSHRKDGVRSRGAPHPQGLAELFSLPDGYEVLIGNGGSTLFWDAAVVRAHRAAEHASRDRRVLVEVRGGHAAAPHLDDPQVRETEPDCAPSYPIASRATCTRIRTTRPPPA